jgi:hypothetical protein
MSLVDQAAMVRAGGGAVFVGTVSSSPVEASVDLSPEIRPGLYQAHAMESVMVSVADDLSSGIGAVTVVSGPTGETWWSTADGAPHPDAGSLGRPSSCINPLHQSLSEAVGLRLWITWSACSAPCDFGVQWHAEVNSEAGTASGDGTSGGDVALQDLRL